MLEIQYQKLGLPGEIRLSHSCGRWKHKIMNDTLIYGSLQGPFEIKSEPILKDILVTKAEIF